MNSLTTSLAIGLPQGSEWIWILVVFVFLFGANKIPQLARSIGKGITEFKRGLKDPTEGGEDDESKPPSKPN